MLDSKISVTQLLIENRSTISVEHAVSLLEPLTIGFKQTSPILPKDARLFRVRVLSELPRNISDLGAPPDNVALMGRVNDTGKSVLYLSDLPRTAIAETRVQKGPCCLTEWQTTADNLLCANGGIL
ncbi:RES family NAD+ phosphorylase [Pseudidiomarina atlantica]|uniref:RES family NAD+ phosphorylase n=1 Tax=Pseudidiomarina atlantica TaxID=1517416 RepID=UPI0012E030AB